ncbi:MAG: hypothetical protein LC725_09260, partial [Lentisphaerae bacterium]|nr:hypothetical protein [Lentisphaerota bacterium]
MKTKHIPGVSLVFALALYAWLSWPLPLFLTSGIPDRASPRNTSIHLMEPGDHLQLMYHFWLAGDMLAGRTTPFHNLYEFNTGDDRERYSPGSYYIPFSLIYSGIAALGGQALGWNLTSFLAVWGTLLLTWLLTRRYVEEEWLAALTAIVSLLLPFRWINLFGGSPAGFAMLWVPAIWLGVDLAVRRRSLAGGALAGISVCLASWCDTHVFFFSVLALPAWAILAFVADGGFRQRSFREYAGIVIALLPLVLGVGLALASPAIFQWMTIRHTGTAPEPRLLSQRTLDEVRLYSPPARGLFDPRVPGLGEHVYIGLAAPLLIMLGGLAWLVQSPRHWRKHAGHLAMWLLICCVIAVTALLALGVRGPGGGELLAIARRLIPPYSMVRQTAKIFILMPSLLAVAMAIAGGILMRRLRYRKIGLGLTVLLCLAAAYEYSKQVHAGISLLESSQGAYAAVANDAAAKGLAPRALAIPLWPGDSHYTSFYQHFAAIYRIRMVNGYRPFVRENYYTNVFEKLVSVNQGWLTDEQIEHLSAMNIDYIMLHEDKFPEKVSPFPVTQTLRNLLEHPRLELLHQDQSVWAFRLLDQPSSKPPYAPHWDVYGSARHWDATRTRHVKAQTVDDLQAGGGQALA